MTVAAFRRGFVPCAGCTLCCEKETVFVDPEYGDDPSKYDTIEATHPLTGKPGLMLKRGADGVSCGYLKKGIGCTIYDKRPAVCREFDCRDFYLTSGSRADRKRLIAKGLVTKEIVIRGRSLLKEKEDAA